MLDPYGDNMTTMMIYTKTLRFSGNNYRYQPIQGDILREAWPATIYCYTVLWEG